MGKQVKKQEVTQTKTKSRRPILRGKNSPIDAPKAFRSLKGFYTKDLVGPKGRKLYVS